jgi:putative SOS response-associated peptidase YedK
MYYVLRLTVREEAPMSHGPAAQTVIVPATQDVIIRQRPDGVRERVPSRWGLIPHDASDPRALRSRLIHARAETLSTTQSFRPLIARNRCVIPANGFYEGPGTSEGRRTFLVTRRDGAPLILVGLWDIWEDRQTREVITSHVLIMCPANATLAPLTGRMPVVLERADLDRWLDSSVTDLAAVLPLLVPCPEDVLTVLDVTERYGARERRAATRAHTLPLPL